jgi:hypothetical protein
MQCRDFGMVILLLSLSVGLCAAQTVEPCSSGEPIMRRSMHGGLNAWLSKSRTELRRAKYRDEELQSIGKGQRGTRRRAGRNVADATRI